jgi:hypothetical protein
MAVKTLAIRLEDDVHAQLAMVAQLDGTTVTEEIRQAIEAHLARKRDSGELSERANAVLEEIEQEATAKKNAIQALFQQATSPPPKGRKGTGQSGS